MTSRRNFLKKGTVGAIAAGLTLGLGEKISARESFASDKTLIHLDRAAFASQLGSAFLINRGQKQISLKLIDVVDRGSKKTMSRDREAFTLVLRGSNSATLTQETYAIEHEKLGAFSMLVVPVSSRDQDARYYEININRLHG
ncbi:MAG TPA: twin-arginine translocation signal domain-containing protein [Pyrinomonadaceae bacterium]|nr:twin-arginine translocation signal domain-containing protein [Pyrinomonadaceae bacterium]